MTEMVTLLSPDGRAIGSFPKTRVHGQHTPLHLAFSCHVLSPDGNVLVTRRALTKKTWPGVWTNSFCGHPAPATDAAPAEDMDAAITRRAREELGLTVTGIRVIVDDFRYRARDASGIEENEICPVYLAHTDSDPVPCGDEVAQWEWTQTEQLHTAVTAAPWAFSPWLVQHLDQALPALTTGRAAQGGPE